MNSFSKSALYTFLTQIPTQLFGIISGIFITRILGPEGKGVYTIFYADVGLFTTLLGFSINTAITYYKASLKITQEKLIGISAIFTLATMVLSVIVLFIWINMPFANALFPKEYLTYSYFAWFLLFILITQVNTVYSSIFQGARMFNVVNRVLVINSIINIVLYGLAYILHQLNIIQIGIDEILLIALIVLFLNGFQWHLHYRKHLSYKVSFDLKWKDEFKPFFRFVGLTHFAAVINLFNYRLVIWIIQYNMDTAQVGIYSIAVGLAQMLAFLTNPLNQVLMPFLSAENEEGRNQMFVKFARIHFFVIVGIGFMMFLCAPFLIPILYGEEFNASVIPFNILLVGTIFSAQTKLIASYFASIGRMDFNFYASSVGFILTFGFNFILIQEYLIKGAAIAQTITYLGIFLFVFIFLRRFGNLRSLNIFIPTATDYQYVKNRLKSRRNK